MKNKDNGAPMSNVIEQINNKLNQLQFLSSVKDSPQSEVLSTFDEFLDIFVGIGHYSRKTWPIEHTSNWWVHFNKLTKTEYISHFLAKVNQRIKDPNTAPSALEPLCFLDIELRWAESEEEVDRKVLEELTTKYIAEYPYNLELLHSRAHLLSLDEETSSESLDKYKMCFEKWGKNTPKRMLSLVFNEQVNRFNKLIDKSEFEAARGVLNKLSECDFYTDNPLSNNNIFALRQRLKDREFTQEKAREIESNIQSRMRLESETQNKKSIEQLGLFSAVITFIVTAAASSFNSFKALTPVILISIGLILVLLIATISVCNTPPKQAAWKDKRIWMLFGYLLATGAITTVELLRPSAQEFVSTSIEKRISQNPNDYKDLIESMVAKELKKQTIELDAALSKDIQPIIEKVVTQRVKELLEQKKEQQEFVINKQVKETLEHRQR